MRSTVTRLRYDLAPGEFLFDIHAEDTPVGHWAKLLSSSSVYRLFYNYTCIISVSRFRGVLYF